MNRKYPDHWLNECESGRPCDGCGLRRNTYAHVLGMNGVGPGRYLCLPCYDMSPPTNAPPTYCFHCGRGERDGLTIWTVKGLGCCYDCYQSKNPPTNVPVTAPLVTDADREMFRTRHGTHGPWCNMENCDDYRRAEQGGTLRDDYAMPLDPCAYPELARPEETEPPALTALRARVASQHLSRGDMEAERARLEAELDIESGAAAVHEEACEDIQCDIEALDALIVEAGGTSCYENHEDDED